MKRNHEAVAKKRTQTHCNTA